METIKDILKNKNTCAMALIMSYDNNGIKPKKLYRVLSCDVYYLIDYYVRIDYLLCQSKTLSTNFYKPTFEQTSLNVLLGISIL